MSEEFELPHYPSLARCLLVDARHGSRFDIAKDLKASLLFAQVWEAQSLGGALTTLEMEQMDACFLGPSVTVEKAVQFLERALKRSAAKDIAFIAVINRSDESSEPVLLSAGVHGVVKRPCTKMSLFDWVVRAVVKANGNGAWAKIFKDSGHEKLSVPDALAKKPAEVATPAEAVAPPVVAPAETQPKPVEDAMYHAILTASAPDLREIIQGIESGEFRLDPSGQPTPRTREAIKNLRDKVLSKVPEADEETAEFIGFFEGALMQWFIDLIQTDQNVATEKLRLKLLSFSPGS